MNVLMIGGSNSLMNALIKKMNKEGHRVSLLSGSQYQSAPYERVFERYDFGYDSTSLTEVFESVSPDLTIYLGAFDANFPQGGSRAESVRYVSGLMNILMGFSALRQGRFVYLSSQEVFSGMTGKPLEDDDPSDASEYRGMAIAQGEELCESFRVARELDVAVVRLGGYFYCPKSLAQVDNMVSRMCLQAMSTGKIPASEGHRFSLLAESDAVQFIAQLALAKDHKEFRYNLSGDQEITELELAQEIRSLFEMKRKVTVREKRADRQAEKAAKKQAKRTGEKKKTAKEVKRPEAAREFKVMTEKTADRRNLVLNNARYRKEFGMNRFVDQDAALGDIVDYMLAHQEVFLQDTGEKEPVLKKLLGKAGWFINAVLPFVENLLCFIPFFMLNNRAVGSQFFSRVDFYLIYVLLFAILHGQQQATLSAMLATAGFIFRQMYERSGFDVLLDYNTYIWVAQLFIVGMIVGYMKDRINAQKEEAREDHSYMIRQVDDIKEINSSNVRIKDAMQTQIINQSDSVGKIYEVTSSLSQYSTDEVLFYAAEILEQIMGCEDVAIYTVASGPYARLFTATSPLARSLGNSTKYQELEGLYEEVSQHHVFINRSLDPRLPMMADGIYEGDDLRLLIMIWKLPWEKMTLGQANLLAVTGALIQNATLRANRYLEALHQERFEGDTPILKAEAFESMLEAYQRAEERSLTEFTVLQADLGGRDPEEVGREVAKAMRANDFVGHGKDGGIYMLLTNTDDAGAQIVARRISERVCPCRILGSEGGTS